MSAAKRCDDTLGLIDSVVEEYEARWGVPYADRQALPIVQTTCASGARPSRARRRMARS